MIQDFKIRAKDLPYSIKKDIIKSYIGKENLFHHELKILLENITRCANQLSIFYILCQVAARRKYVGNKMIKIIEI